MLTVSLHSENSNYRENFAEGTLGGGGGGGGLGLPRPMHLCLEKEEVNKLLPVISYQDLCFRNFFQAMQISLFPMTNQPVKIKPKYII